MLTNDARRISAGVQRPGELVGGDGAETRAGLGAGGNLSPGSRREQQRGTCGERK